MNNFNCARPLKYSEVEQVLSENHLSFRDWKYQLPTNYAFIFELPDNKIILMPSFPSEDLPICILFENQDCFAKFQANDKYPVENYNKDIVEYAQEDIISLNFEKFLNQLNQYYHVNLVDINVETANTFFECMSNRNVENKLHVALGMVMGEALRKKMKGKWAFKKMYGPYNPYYEPFIIENDTAIDIFSRLLSTIHSKRGPNIFFIDSPRGKYSIKKLHNDGVVFIDPAIIR